MTIDDAAVILHTSGTTNGIHKPIPHSDIGLNEGAYRVMRSDLAADVGPKDACLLLMDLSSAYAMADMLHPPLSLGAQVASVPMAIMNPKLPNTFSYYGINYALLSPPTLDMFCNGPKPPNLSSVRMPILGGVYLSADERHRLNEILKKCGSNARIINGYGLSEVAGAIIISPADREDDTIGYPLPGVNVLIRDEDDKTIHDTVPALYVTCTTKGHKALMTVRDALVEVFVHEGNISNTNLPGQCVICKNIPRTTTGKVDVHQIMNGTVQGDHYRVAPIHADGKLVDVRLVPAANHLGMTAGLPEELNPILHAQKQRKGQRDARTPPSCVKGCAKSDALCTLRADEMFEPSSSYASSCSPHLSVCYFGKVRKSIAGKTRTTKGAQHGPTERLPVGWSGRSTPA